MPQIRNSGLRIHLIAYIIILCTIVRTLSTVLDSCDKTRRVFTETWGVITDGPVESNYTQDSHCEWLIKANGTNRFITLTFRSMGTECSYDYVFVYDGDSFSSPLLGSFSGKTAPQQVIASSGYMLILLYSDTNYVLNGFRAEFSVTDCPNNCSHNGICIKHLCVCFDNRGGKDCSQELCPDNCGKAHNRGYCYQGKCICNEGYSGYSCSLTNRDTEGNKWHWLSHTGGGMTPRAAHTAVYLEESDQLYVYGGYDLNKVLGDLEVYHFSNSSWTTVNGESLTDEIIQTNVDPFSVADLLKQVGPEGQEKWGLHSKNLFKNILLAGNTNLTRRSSRVTRSVYEPAPRYGHASCAIPGGFLIYGGKLDNGNLSNELWSYNIYTKQWTLRALNSEISPPPLTRHSLTSTGDYIYLFGGSTVDGEFSSKLYKIRILEDYNNETWEYVQPRGGKELDVRVVAHSTVYHKQSNSLLVYGGVVAGVARFSKLSDRMFAFQIDSKHWTELHYPTEHLRENFVPRERAFHTASIIGNYLIVFGGYSHRHNKEEICYDNQMYLYHLGCHAWVNPYILGEGAKSQYPKQQGVFAHAASVRNENTLLIVGGYHGNINGDLLAYTVPPMIGARKGEHYEPEAVCGRHKTYNECTADPECGWCKSDDWCYGSTVGANCTTNLFTMRCPGVCPALGDCHSCLIHGKSVSNAAPHKLGDSKCSWCVQNARCHDKNDNYGVCGVNEGSPFQTPGWWGNKGTEVHKPEHCRQMDKRPGLTFLKYHHPVNYTQPDVVAIMNATTVDFSPPTSIRIKGNQAGVMVARLIGFLRPPPNWEQEKLQVCVTYCNATLKLSDEKGEHQTITTLSTEHKPKCKTEDWLISEPNRISVDFKSQKGISSGHYHHQPQQSKMELQHIKDSNEKPKVFTFEYLEPYANGSCSEYTNCLYCLTDSLCGWCDLTNKCVSRNLDETESCTLNGDWRYLTLLPSACSNCSNYISCEKCIDTGLCEWWVDDARCMRHGVGTHDVVSTLDKCPVPCYARTDCNSCLDVRGRCVWCEATQQCFSFSVYTSEYQFGICREWLDQISPMPSTPTIDGLYLPTHRADQCKSCQSHTNCSTCLSTLSCGWCYSKDNPILGTCIQGDFNHPQISCEGILNMTANSTKWAYAQCPDVDECGLGLHDCHKEAICTNTDGSFSCKCRQGFAGDGKNNCTRTCDHPCINGRCLGSPNYTCECNLGWTGEDCSIDCGCNFHSNCTSGVGICDNCQDWTTGKNCEQCMIGSFGNATTLEGCKKCDCNNHGNITAGICNMTTGECYCQDNTEGRRCEKCKQNYYGIPINGEQCYYQCEARGMLTQSIGQGISSHHAYMAPWSGPPPRECLWIISPNLKSSIIQLEVNVNQLNVSCGENAVYVYDGMPELVDTSQQSSLMAVFCREESRKNMVIETKSGHLTVHYKQGMPGEGFNAFYRVLSCEEECNPPRFCRNGQCLCQENFYGPDCSEKICPNDCGSEEKRGECDRTYGRCICASDWGGPDCLTRLNGSQIVFTELFNTQSLAQNVEHLRKTLPRFGHSLVADHRRGLWIFGGYSLSHGPLNDIRLFDILNNTWMQVTVDSTPEAKMPQGRYYHAADIVHSKQAIYIFGGLSKHDRNQLNENVLDDFWQFDLHNQRWNEISHSKNWPPPLAGHTLTTYRSASYDSLILIGGFSPKFGLLSVPWEFRLDKGEWSTMNIKGKGPLGVFGHSTVFHSQTNSLYIFGGYVYQNNRTVLSNWLYILRYETMHWVNLNMDDLYSVYPGLPRARYLHSAITTDSYMIIFGGKISPWNHTNSFFAYSYNCSYWINLLSDDTNRVGRVPTQTYAQAMTYENGSIYVVGGWEGESQCKVTKISIPEDLCKLRSSSKYKCSQFRGCGFCSIEMFDGNNITHCYSNSKDAPEQCTAQIGILSSQNGFSCDGEPPINCSAQKDCHACLQSPGCQWCQNCSGRCRPANEICPKYDNCTDLAPITSILECPEVDTCLASDCTQCSQLNNCIWTRKSEDHYSKNLYHCVPQPSTTALVPKDESICEKPCVNFTSCADCLLVENCHWSTQLNECISVNYQPLYCTGGVCGLVLQNDERDQCPEPCESYTQCSTCLRHAHCGWCALDDEQGLGVCTEGSSERPVSSNCPTLYRERQNNSDHITDLTIANFTWNYVRCPPENECLNDHHSCDKDREICVDLRHGFKCICGPGYNNSANGCVPECTQGCVRGVCVEPNKCQCDFGYVGANCSIECQCNGHSNCAGPDKLKECLECHNNTMGDQCEKCKPLFVGNPVNRERCTPCFEYCNEHTHICVYENSTDPEPYPNMTLTEIASYLKVGPTGKARCIRCGNKTMGNKCDECVPGNFRGSLDPKVSCRPCNCHGHGDMCDPVYGDKCNCKNNTESNATCKNSNHDKCSEVQCVKCKDTYMGTPTDGHQCYKQMTVDSKMCFDAKLIDECKRKPNPLHPGETVFFVVQPRFMNVDIRITIDVTQGVLNLFIANRDDVFKVTPNLTTGIHDIDLDSRYMIVPPSKDNKAYENGNVYSWMEHNANGLRTYVTIPKNTTLLAIRGLKDRLVITLPQDAHMLDKTKFYIVLQALPSNDGSPSIPSYGMIFFRQDQLHIDLFVFFSVFFSCFFLFLAACVVTWKAKQAADVRRARRRHVVEMLHMAQRPFAGVTIFLGPSTPSCGRRGKPRRITSMSDVKPVAIEPTEDGIAAVATVFVSLPGGQSAHTRLALASSLILLARQYPSGGRAFLRRRSHHAVPPPPT